MNGADLLFADEKQTPTSGADTLFGDEKSQREQGIQFVMDAAANESPDQAARALELQQKLGVPKKFILDNFAELDTEAKKAEFDAKSFTRSNPKVADWLAKNPDYAPLIREDGENLSTFEKLFASKGDSWSTVYDKAKQNVSHTLNRSFVAGTQQMAGAFEEAPLSTAENIGKSTVRTLGYLLGGMAWTADTIGKYATFDSDKVTSFKDTIGMIDDNTPAAAYTPEEMAKIKANPTYQEGLDRAKFHTEQIAANKPNVQNWSAKDLAFSAGTSIFSNVLPTIVGSLAGGPAGGTATFSGQIFADTVASETASGKSLTQALDYATWKVFSEGIPESIPLSAAHKIGVGFWKKVGTVSAIEGAEEILTELADIAYEKYKQEKDITLREGIDRVLKAGVVGAISGGVLGAAHAGPNAIQTRIDGKKNQAFFEALADTAQNSKLRERLPDKFQELVADMTKDGPVENVYAPVELFQTHWQEQGVDPADVAKELGIERQYQEAIDTGSKIAIPTSVYARHIAPTEHNAVFVNDLSFGADQMSANETKAFFKQQEADMAEQAKQLQEGQTPDQRAQFDTEMEQVMAPIREQVTALYPKGQAETHIKLIEQQKRVRALRLGKSPLALEQARPMTIGEGEGGTGATLNQAAYHGSPHRFDKFDSSKIGTGEGAQAYGHGLYFAENPGVAGEYQKQLAGDGFLKADGSVFDPQKSLKHLNVKVPMYKGDIEEAISRAKQISKSDSPSANLAASDLEILLEIKKSGGLTKNTGNIYTVDIPEEHVEKMLDWDKPLSEQTENVRKALIDAAKKEHPRLSEYWQKTAGMSQEESAKVAKSMNLNVFDTIDAGGAALEAILGKGPEASKYLKSKGIPGIKYLDQGSRAAGEGSRNFVVFDDSIVTILDINGEPVSKKEQKQVISDMNAENDKNTLYQSTKQTQTPEFQNWFGKSKVVDEKGEPLVVYHGTAETFNEFALGDPSNLFPDSGIGFFFASRPSEAGFFTQSVTDLTGARGDRYSRGANLMPVYLRLKNPKIYETQKEYIADLNNTEYHREGPGAALYERLKTEGHDGVLIEDSQLDKDGGGRWFIAFTNEQIKSAIGNRGTFDPNDPNILYQADQSTWFSALEKGIESAKQAKATAKDWKAIIPKLAGVKADEIEATGLNEWLDMQTGQVTKESVLEFVRQNGVQVQEVEKGGEKEGLKIQPNEDETAYAGHEMVDVVQVSNGITRFSGTPSEARNYMEEEALAGKYGATKFSSYQLPGGENYRELLLTLPDKESPQLQAARAVEAAQKNYERQNDSANYGALVRAREAADKIGASWEPQKFRSSHFDEPNILAHVRFNERTDAEGKKVLFIEEVQSDWAQKGRKEGFSAPVEHEYSIQANPSRGTWDVLDHKGNRLDSYPTREAAQRVADSSKKMTTGVPSAPFVTKTEAWTLLAMKRMIRYAAENGFDRIAWTTGEQQAARYDLSKQVEAITWQKQGDRYQIFVYPKTGNQIEKNLAPSEIQDFVGKEASDKITGSGKDTGELRGLDLKVGGEGMKAFYDQMLPQVVNKYVKKWGGKVGETTIVGKQEEDVMNGIEAEEGQFTAPSIDITPALRESVMQGQPLFQGKDITRGSITATSSGDIIRLFKSKNLSTLLHELGHRWLFEMMDDASMLDAPQQIKDDMAKALKFLGVESIDELRLDKPGTPEHAKAVEANEKWARAIETYLKEGKAPSQELRRVFAQIKAWLVAVYDALKQGRLDVDLSPEIRGVFDRLLATDQEIQAVQEEANAKAHFLTAEEAGMPEAEFAAYQKTLEDANQSARDELDAKAMAEFRRTLKSEWKAEREKTRAEVEADVDQIPVYQTIAKMVKEGLKLDRNAVKAMGKDIVKRVPRETMSATDGMPLDLAADLLGYTSGESMVKEIASAERRTARIERETDIRMNAKFGNMLEDGTLRDEARRAVMNDDRAKVIEAEIKALNKKAREVSKFTKAKDKAQNEQDRAGRDLYKALVPKLADVREHAAAVISAKPVRELKPMTYYNLARQASRQAVEDTRKGDYLMAGYNKGRELLNLELFREAVKAKDAIEDGNRKLAKLFGPDEKLAKSRDMNMVNVARAILASHGIGRTEASPLSYLEKMRQYEPMIYENMRPIFEPAMDDKHYKDMTVAEYMAMKDAVDALIDVSRRSRQMVVDGKLVERQEAVDALVGRIGDLNKGKVAPELRTTGTEAEKTKIGFLTVKAAMRRVESWVTAMDGGPDGPFRRYIWNPVIDAVNKYRDEKRAVMEKYLKMLADVAPGITHEAIEAPELGFKFQGKVELLHAVLHTGNDSNKTKLLVGYSKKTGKKWGEVQEDGTLVSTLWDSFEKRMQDEGILTKADYDFAQNVWNMMEEMKPQLQKAHKAMYGFHFNEVTANPFSNRFGTYAGGYVPAKVDTNQVASAERHQDADQIVQGQNSFAFPTTGKGATMKRMEGYADPLQLDMRSIPAHIDWAMRFAYIEPAAKDVARLMLNKQFADAMNEMDRGVINHMINPWLQRTAQQTTTTRGINKHVDKFWSAVRNRSGMQVMVANVINTMQQFTGLTAALTRIKAGSARTAFWQYITNHKAMSEEISEKSSFMRNRVFTAQNEVLQSINDILLNPTKYEKAKDFATKHGYFMQQATQGFVDQIVWKAAYNEATENGLNEKEAVRHADSTVRETQGSFSPEDISRLEASTPFVRAFTMFYNFFNMQANLLGTEFSKIASNELGLRKGAGRALYVYTMAFMIPAFIGDALIRALISGKPDDDDDGYMNDLIAMFFNSQFRAVTAMVPGVGPVAQNVLGYFNGKPYDDHITASPAISMVESAGRTPFSVYKAIMDDGNQKKAVKDTLTLIGLMTGLPAGALGRPLGYLADVNQGKAQPENAMDFARGLVSGQDVNRSK